MTDDPDALRHLLDRLTYAAGYIRRHAADLHSYAWEASVSGSEPVEATKTDWAPRTGPEAALALWRRLSDDVSRVDALLVGDARAITRLFTSRDDPADPTRGSLIRADEHTRLLERQQARAEAGEYTPVRLVGQPPHPGTTR